MSLRTHCRTGALAAVFAAAAAAQKEGPVGPPLQVQGSLLAPRPPAAEEGVPVRMFESPTLDRFLRKARDFLDRQDYGGAIKVVQDVLEGRVQPGAGLEDGAGATAGGAAAGFEDDPHHAVFSVDGRVYRPVRRLCLELLASLPEPGRVLYRERYEVAAERDYRAALAARDISGLEATYQRYFATHAAARAMAAAGDLLMHSGRHRAAIQRFRLLLEMYPRALLAEVEDVSETYIRLKAALCLAMLGERGSADEALATLARDRPGDSVRVQGEPLAVEQLRAFAGVEGAAPQPSTRTPTSLLQEALALRTPEALIPVWEHRFADPQPYRRPSGSREPRFTISGAAAAAPPYSQFAPGTAVLCTADRLALLDHFRLRVHDLGTGMMLQEGDGPLVPPAPRQGQPRVRVPVYDWATARVAEDGEHYYYVRGASHTAAGRLDPILSNHLLARDRATLEPVWATRDREAAEESRPTFLATPTAFGQRLIAPVLVAGAYAVQANDPKTGEVLFRVPLHVGGSELARAPASPAAVDMGTAYVLTSAGTLGAVDAYTGELLWVRRYERAHPFRPSPRRAPRGRTAMALNQAFRELRLTSFVPSELIAIDGRVIAAPADSDVLLCLDSTSGELRWLLSHPPDRSVYVLGHNSRYLYLCGERTLMCIDHRSGVRLWQVDTPTGRWEGRGLVDERCILLPAERCVYARPADGSGDWRRIELPRSFVGREPLQPPANLFAAGPYLILGFEGGIEVFAAADALYELAASTDDPAERAGLLVQAGDLAAAIELLGPLAADPARPAAERAAAARRVLALVRDVVLAAAAREAAVGSHGQGRDDALALLDRCRSWALDPDLALRCQLLRVELFEQLGEHENAERAQDVLYAMMEGRR